MNAAIVDGRLYALNSQVKATSLQIAGRNARDLACALRKPDGQNLYQFADLRAKLAGGDLAGQVDLGIPRHGNSRYALSLVLKDADVSELAQEKQPNLKGRISASLALAGNWDDVTTRRGRGDVRVDGKELYHIPVMLGLLQITNLTLPIRTPFTEGTTLYVVQGNRVTLEQIELRTANMVMQGSGWLDFGTKKVQMTFQTDNPAWPKLPLIGELLEGAKKELFQIYVKGTIQEPQIGARSFNTFTTTVDEVFKGRPEQNGKGKK
jgi:AsmA-like C-terminal region